MEEREDQGRKTKEQGNWFCHEGLEKKEEKQGN